MIDENGIENFSIYTKMIITQAFKQLWAECIYNNLNISIEVDCYQYVVCTNANYYYNVKFDQVEVL